MRVHQAVFVLMLFFATASSVMTDAMLEYEARFKAINQSWKSKFSLNGVYGTNTVPLL